MRNWQLTCPYCFFTDRAKSFTNFEMKLTDYGFTSCSCPKCQETIIFDVHTKQLFAYGTGRQPLLIPFRIVYIADIVILAFIFVMSMVSTVSLIWPLSYMLLWLIDLTWEYLLKKKNPDWYFDNSLDQWIKSKLKIVRPVMYSLKIVLILVFLGIMLFSRI